jgi:hypothetical protein
LFLMFSKCYYHLHPLVEPERGVVEQRLKRIGVWISLKWQPTQVSQQHNWSTKNF